MNPKRARCRGVEVRSCVHAFVQYMKIAIP
jgi:hypothetical protein